MHTPDASDADKDITAHTETANQSNLQWQAGLPYSARFDDVYFSKADGLAETRYVFLQHNHLDERWRALANADHFTVAETGFGTGLNFLAAMELWLTTAPATATLHYLSVEKYPLNKAELQQALSLWPALEAHAQSLLAVYPEHLEHEIYALSLAGGRIRLTLIIDDATRGLGHCLHHQHPDFIAPRCQVDAWFLDGFAPAKNPAMWTPALFTCMAQLSHSGTTLATFTSAGLVRRGLAAAGFATQKATGFGRKREMLTATFAGRPESKADVAPPTHGRPSAPWQLTHCRPAGKHALVIGAGIAGCHSARALAARGWQVTVVDAGSGPATAASGNAQGVVYAKLSPKRHPQGRFNLAALNYAQQAYQAFWAQHPEQGAACGVLQLSAGASDDAHQQAASTPLPGTQARWVSAEEASALAGLPVANGGLFLPQAGWLNPPALCTWLLDHPGIHCHFHWRATQLVPLPADRWRLVSDQAATLDADLLVVACAYQAAQFEQLSHLPLKSIRGQVTQVPSRAPLRDLRCVITREGYLAPAYQGQHSLGATFTLKNTHPAVTDADHRENLQQLEGLLPDLPTASLQPTDGKVGFRCTTPDYLPIVGPLADAEAMTQVYAPLARNARAAVPRAPHYWPNLLVNLAHGSRGLAYTPLCAEYLAALADNTPPPLHPELIKALHPARFLLRDIARGKRRPPRSSTL